VGHETVVATGVIRLAPTRHPLDDRHHLRSGGEARPRGPQRRADIVRRPRDVPRSHRRPQRRRQRPRDRHRGARPRAGAGPPAFSPTPTSSHRRSLSRPRRSATSRSQRSTARRSNPTPAGSSRDPSTRARTRARRSGRVRGRPPIRYADDRAAPRRRDRPGGEWGLRGRTPLAGRLPGAERSRERHAVADSNWRETVMLASLRSAPRAGTSRAQIPSERFSLTPKTGSPDAPTGI